MDPEIPKHTRLSYTVAARIATLPYPQQRELAQRAVRGEFGSADVAQAVADISKRDHLEIKIRKPRVDQTVHGLTRSVFRATEEAGKALQRLRSPRKSEVLAEMEPQQRESVEKHIKIAIRDLESLRNILTKTDAESV